MRPRQHRGHLQLQPLVRRQELPDQPETAPHCRSCLSLSDDDHCLRSILLLLQRPAKEEHPTSIWSKHGPSAAPRERAGPDDGPNRDSEVGHVRTQQAGEEQTFRGSRWRPQWTSPPATASLQPGLSEPSSGNLAGQLWECDEPGKPGGQRDQQCGRAQGQT